MRARLTAVLATTATLTLVTAGAALAEANGKPITNPANVYQANAYNGDLTPSTDSTIGWQDVGNNGDDSQTDTNDRALVADVKVGDFAESFTDKSLVLNKPVADVKNVSLDYRTSTITGAGQVYIGIATSETFLFLDPAHCTQQIGASSWSRSDFTGETGLGECTIFDQSSVPYASDGTQSALDVYASLHPTDQASYSFLGFFGVNGVDQFYVVDRVALGTDRLYNFGPNRAKRCLGDENRC